MKKQMPIESFMKMADIFDELTNDEDRSKAYNLIARLYDHERLMESSGEPFVLENDFFEANPDLTQSKQNAQNKRAIKIYNYLHKLCLDRTLSKKFAEGLCDLLLKCVPGYGFIWRIATIPKHRGRPTEHEKKEIISELVDAFSRNTKSKELAYEKVADLLACISLKISPSTVRAHYEDATGRRNRPKK